MGAIYGAFTRAVPLSSASGLPTTACPISPATGATAQGGTGRTPGASTSIHGAAVTAAQDAGQVHDPGTLLSSSPCLQQQQQELARHHSTVTVAFMDIAGYTSMSEQLDAVQVMKYINQVCRCVRHVTMCGCGRMYRKHCDAGGVCAAHSVLLYCTRLV